MQILLLSASDKALLSQAVSQAVDEFLGDESRDLALSRFDEQSYLSAPEDGPVTKDVSVVVDAARTAPMLSSKRVVLARELASVGSGKDSFTPLLNYLADPSPHSSLILVWEGGPSTKTMPRLPQSLVKAVRDAGGESRNVSPGRAQKGKPSEWFDQQLSSSGVLLDGNARSLIWSWLGEDGHANLMGLLDVLESAYGAGQKLGEDEVSKFLGASEEGTVALWKLPDAIDDSNLDLALETLRRLLANGAFHPFVVLATLQRHFEQIMKLDSDQSLSDTKAAELLGLKPNMKFKAKKLQQRTRQLGTDKIARCVKFIAEADLDVRGKSGLDQEIVLEILVARLASQ